MGQKPAKKVGVTVFLSPEVIGLLKEAAGAKAASVSGFIRASVTRSVRRWKGKGKSRG